MYTDDNFTDDIKSDSQGHKEKSQSFANNMDSPKTDSNNSMISFTRVIVTIIVIILFFVVFGAIVGVGESSGHSTPGILGLIVFAAMIGALRAIWRKPKNKDKTDNTSILQK